MYTIIVNYMCIRCVTVYIAVHLHTVRNTSSIVEFVYCHARNKYNVSTGKVHDYADAVHRNISVTPHLCK